MKVAVKNIRNSNHTICRVNGEKLLINPRGFVVFDVDSERETAYWTAMSNRDTSSYGLEIITDTSKIYELESGAFNNSSIVDNFVSPIAREIAETTKVSKPDTGCEEIDNTNQEFTEEKLLQMDKEDLFNLCDNFSIKYKRNNSVKTLVKLLVENGVVDK